MAHAAAHDGELCHTTEAPTSYTACTPRSNCVLEAIYVRGGASKLCDAMCEYAEASKLRDVIHVYDEAPKLCGAMRFDAMRCEV